MSQTNNTENTLFQQGNVKELLSAGKALGQPIILPNLAPRVLVPEGFTLEPLPMSEIAPLPDHIRQKVTLNDAESFARYVERYKDKRTMIFARLPSENGASASFEAVLDFHKARADALGVDEGGAQRCSHTAVYPCPFSPEWKTWTGVNGKAKAQKEFIDFIDENAPDIQAPATADLMELAMTFEARTDVVFQSKIDRLTNGRQLTYSENVDAGGTARAGKMKVPDSLSLRLPVFEGGPLYDVNARLEWVPREGKLSIVVHLRRPHEVIRAAIDALRDEIEKETGIAPLTGSAAGI